MSFFHESNQTTYSDYYAEQTDFLDLQTDKRCKICGLDIVEEHSFIMSNNMR